MVRVAGANRARATQRSERATAAARVTAVPEPKAACTRLATTVAPIVPMKMVNGGDGFLLAKQRMEEAQIGGPLSLSPVICSSLARRSRQLKSPPHARPTSAILARSVGGFFEATRFGGLGATKADGLASAAAHGRRVGSIAAAGASSRSSAIDVRRMCAAAALR